MIRSVLAVAIVALSIAVGGSTVRAAPNDVPPVEVCRENLMECQRSCQGNMGCYGWCEQLYQKCIGPDRPENPNPARSRGLLGPRNNILEAAPGLPPRGPATTGAPIAPTAPPMLLK
jgi:hypothetical protein